MSTLERLNQMEFQINQLRSYALDLHKQCAEITAANAHLGKMVAALTETLTGTGVITDRAVMAKIVEMEDNQTRDHITQLLKLSQIVASENVNEKSALILRQTKDGEIISNCFLTPFSSLAPELAETLLGVTVGHKFTHGEVESELLEIYNQAE